LISAKNQSGGEARVTEAKRGTVYMSVLDAVPDEAGEQT
jgi:hypothetical protein